MNTIPRLAGPVVALLAMVSCLSADMIGSAFDLSGVGRANRWGTLISNNVIITASHSRPSGEIAFYPGNDPNQAPVLRNIQGGQQIGDSDIYLAVLDAPVLSGTQIYDFATELISAPPFDPDTNSGLFNAGSFQGEDVFTYGLTPNTFGYLENAEFQDDTNTDFFVMRYNDRADADYLQHESLFRAGDSGAPLFVERDGELLLLGINTAVTLATEPDQFSFVTYVGNHTDEINSFIAANAIPEPGSIAVLLLGVVGWTARRRRAA